MRAEAGHALLLDCRDDTVAHARVRPRRGGAGAARDRHPGRPPQRRRSLRGAAARLRAGRPRARRGARCARWPTPPPATPLDDALRPLAGDETFRLARHVVSEMHRVDAVVGHVARRPHRSHRSPARRLASLAARRLRRLVPRARPRGRRGAGGRRARRPDDRRRASAARRSRSCPAGAAIDVATSVDRAFVDAGFDRPAFLSATASGPAGRVQ